LAIAPGMAEAGIAEADIAIGLLRGGVSKTQGGGCHHPPSRRRCHHRPRCRLLLMVARRHKGVGPGETLLLAVQILGIPGAHAALRQGGIGPNAANPRLVLPLHLFRSRPVNAPRRLQAASSAGFPQRTDRTTATGVRTTRVELSESRSSQQLTTSSLSRTSTSRSKSLCKGTV